MREILKVLLIDNYDSFTYNLAQQIQMEGASVDVRRNDEIHLDEILEGDYSHWVISPGPGHPENVADFGVCGELLKALPDPQPLLGVCLGHQGIAAHFGAEVKQAPRVMHGKVSYVQHEGNGLFIGLPRPLPVMRYHSLCVDLCTLPSCLVPTAWSPSDGVLMAFQHQNRPIYGVQFHPESVGTPHGQALIHNFLSET